MKISLNAFLFLFLVTFAFVDLCPVGVYILKIDPATLLDILSPRYHFCFLITVTTWTGVRIPAREYVIKGSSTSVVGGTSWDSHS